MMEELKPCPFCGGRGRKTMSEYEKYSCANHNTYFDDPKYCNSDANLSKEEWNNRPIENALEKEIAKLKEDIEYWESRCVNNGWRY